MLCHCQYVTFSLAAWRVFHLERRRNQIIVVLHKKYRTTQYLVVRYYDKSVPIWKVSQQQTFFCVFFTITSCLLRLSSSINSIHLCLYCCCCCCCFPSGSWMIQYVNDYWPWWRRKEEGGKNQMGEKKINNRRAELKFFFFFYPQEFAFYSFLFFSFTLFYSPFSIRLVIICRMYQ